MSWRRVVAIGPFVADSDGTDFRTSRLSGWEGAAPARGSIEDRAQQDGGWDAMPFSGPRIVTVDGFVEQGSRAAAIAVMDELAAIQLRDLHELMVDDPDAGPRSCFARVEATADPEWVSPVSFRYTMTLKAADNLKYGPTLVRSTALEGSTPGAGLTFPLAFPLDFGVPTGADPGSVAMPNGGTAGYFLSFRLDGPMPNPIVTANETGEWVRYGGILLAGQWLEVDCARRRVLLNGSVDMTTKVSSSATWPSVPPGGVSVSIDADAGDPAASLTVFGFEGAWT